MISHPVLLELASNMGLALFRIQSAEKALKAALSWLGVDDPNATLAELGARDAARRRLTLGTTLRQFKQHIDLTEDFEVAREEFLASRNLFVHDFQSLPGFTVGTDDGAAVGIEFLRKLTNQADLLTRVVMGLNQMVVNRDAHPPFPDSSDISSEQLNEMFALMYLRPKRDQQ